MTALARSYLYAPGDRPERFAKAAASGADAVVLDLEDGVAAQAKEQARTEVAAFVREPGPQWWVRVDLARVDADIHAAVQPGTRGVVVPGADVDSLAEVDRLLSRHEARAGITEALEIIGLVETPAALRRLDAVCRAPRLLRLGIGEADLAAALGVSPDDQRRELWSVRSDVVVASAAAGLAAPIGPVETRLDDAVMEESTAVLVRQGFTARTAIHPRQIAPIHRALAPSDQQLRAAEEAVATFEEAEDSGAGVAVTADGRMVDLAIVRSARAVLARAGITDRVTQTRALGSDHPEV